MHTKRAAAEQLRKYAAVTRLIREQRMMQKRAGWFWPSKAKDPGVEGQLPANPYDLDSVNDLFQNASKNRALRVERDFLTPEELLQEQWKSDNFNNLSWLWDPIKKWRARPEGSTARFLEDMPVPRDYRGHAPRR